MQVKMSWLEGFERELRFPTAGYVTGTALEGHKKYVVIAEVIKIIR